MSSLILSTATRALQPLMLFTSIFLLLRGHDHPGGGFVGGLVGAGAFGLQSLASGVGSARATLGVDPRFLIGIGAALALIVALAPLLIGAEFFTAIWIQEEIRGVGNVHLGTPLLFDIAVYLIVLGSTLAVLFALEME